jgi:hypothetical protein
MNRANKDSMQIGKITHPTKLGNLGHSTPLTTMCYLSTLGAEEALKIQQQVEFEL